MEKWITFGSGVFLTVLIYGSMILFGWIFVHRPPKEINSVYGYRTTMSTRNRQTWEFAHQYAGRLWWRMGWAGLAVSAVAYALLLFVPWMETGILVLMCLQIIPLGAVIFPTERALKKKFDRFGQPKE